MPYCPHCGKKLEKPVPFCPYCGKSTSSLDEEKPVVNKTPINSSQSNPTPVVASTQTSKQWITGIDNRLIIAGAIVVFVVFLGIIGNIRLPTVNQSPTGASFVISSFTASRYELPANSKFTFNLEAQISNIGDTQGTYNIVITSGSNAQTIKTDSITIPAHTTETWISSGYYGKTPSSNTISLGGSKIVVNYLPYYDANQIVQDYDANEIAADQKYKGKTFYVFGTLYDVGKAAFLDTPYITLDSNLLFNHIQCSFTTSANNQIAALTKGESLVVKGTCSGKILLNPYLDNCSFFNP